MYRYPDEVKIRILELLNLGYSSGKIVIEIKKEFPGLKRYPKRSIICRWGRQAITTRKRKKEKQKYEIEKEEKIVREADSNTRRLLEDAERILKIAETAADSSKDYTAIARTLSSLATVHAHIDGEMMNTTNVNLKGSIDFEDPKEILMGKYPLMQREKKEKKRRIDKNEDDGVDKD